MDTTRSFSSMALVSSKTARRIAKIQGCEDIVFSWLDCRSKPLSGRELEWIEFWRNGVKLAGGGSEMMDVAYSAFKSGQEPPDSLLFCSDFCEGRPAESRWLADKDFVDWLARCGALGVVRGEDIGSGWESKAWSRSLGEALGEAPMVWGSLRDALAARGVGVRKARAQGKEAGCGGESAMKKNMRSRVLAPCWGNAQASRTALKKCGEDLPGIVDRFWG